MTESLEDEIRKLEWCQQKTERELPYFIAGTLLMIETGNLYHDNIARLIGGLSLAATFMYKYVGFDVIDRALRDVRQKN